jgi:uncharacterized damage-inducible protein DinB
MSVVGSLLDEYKRYKALAEAAVAQVGDAELQQLGPGGGNSIDMLMRHLAGNFKSRFTDFRSADGEKPWRHRDGEFEEASMTRSELMSAWDAAWETVISEVSQLTDADLAATVTVRQQPLRIDEALHRSLAHAAYHVGQIVYLAKALRGDSWRTLSIPKGKSEEYNRQATRETAAAHAEMLKQR